MAPQQDILGHPRLRLFITHGGLLSTLESMYNGIPVLGMPVFADQETNMLNVERDGWGLVLLWAQLTPDALKTRIKDVMTNPRLKAEAQRRSVVMQDLPMSPAQVAVYWVEYVMRHHGAAHLRCPAGDLPWYKLYNVDVWASVTVVLLLLTYISLRLFLACCSCLCSSRSKRKTD
ncbi:UDP-glycosyltransferase UGT5-like [Homarus americanus]|uniref:UDP-glycosyltransferase UGT5-like n=1 Tax=Homarus americanus TaxID=6706 RepID=UPI001C470896|nr:UDP-glycosyltransferase UGT5-like [Homarus americanus]